MNSIDRIFIYLRISAKAFEIADDTSRRRTRTSWSNLLSLIENILFIGAWVGDFSEG